LLPGLGILTLLLTGCSKVNSLKEAEDVEVELKLRPQPPKVGKVWVMVDLSDRDGKPVTGASLKLEANMNHAGMKPVFADPKEVVPGRYDANVELTMGGDWYMLITGKLADGRKLKRTIDVPGVKSE
jgi:hypothetical protein